MSIILCDLRVIESPCNYFTLSLRVALVLVAIVGGQPWWWRHNAGGDGDHAGALEMEIKGTRRKGHIISQFYELHVMLILLCTLLLA